MSKIVRKIEQNVGDAAEAPISKRQIPNNIQIPISNDRNGFFLKFGHLVIGSYLEFGIWILGLQCPFGSGYAGLGSGSEPYNSAHSMPGSYGPCIT